MDKKNTDKSPRELDMDDLVGKSFVSEEEYDKLQSRLERCEGLLKTSISYMEQDDCQQGAMVDAINEIEKYFAEGEK